MLIKLKIISLAFMFMENMENMEIYNMVEFVWNNFETHCISYFRN